MASFIFLCDLSTEQECLDRRLFGTNPGDAHKFHYGKIAVGDTLFLYNCETGFLRGPYAALTTCQQNIEPTAWRKSKRNFPWQVRVDGAGAAKTPLGADELRRLVPLSGTRIGLMPPYELTDEQTAAVVAALARAKPPK